MERAFINILLANDNKIIRNGIRLAFEELAPQIQIVQEAESFQDLLKKLTVTEYRILMSDDFMHGENILTYLPGIREQYPELKIILNTIFTEEVPHLAMAKEFSNGWLSFALEPKDFIEALEILYYGENYFQQKD